MTAPMSHTPQQIADLARAALAWNQKSKDFKPNDMERAAAIRDWMAYHEAVRDPATILALVERYREDLEEDWPQQMVEEKMTTPLLPATELEKQQ